MFWLIISSLISYSLILPLSAHTHTQLHTTKMYRAQLICILLVAYSFQTIITLPQGAPESVCHSLLPFHGGGIPPSSSRPPYRIVPHNVAVNQGQILRVEIEPQIPELSFGGFMIHARNINPPYQVVSKEKHAFELIEISCWFSNSKLGF